MIHRIAFQSIVETKIDFDQREDMRRIVETMQSSLSILGMNEPHQCQCHSRLPGLFNTKIKNVTKQWVNYRAAAAAAAGVVVVLPCDERITFMN